MGNPLALLHRLGPSAECHEVSLDNVLCGSRVQPQWQWPGEVVSVERLFTSAHHTDRLR